MPAVFGTTYEGATPSRFAVLNPESLEALTTQTYDQWRDLVAPAWVLLRPELTAWADLPTAVAAFGASRGALAVNVATVVAANLTTPVTLALTIDAGAVLTVNTGAVLTVNGYFSAPPVQCFAGGGTILFGKGAVGDVFPEWFPGSDWGAQCSAAIASVRATGGKVVFTSGATFTTPVNATNCTNGLTLEGRGACADGSLNNAQRLIGNLTTVMFDFTGTNQLRLHNFAVGTSQVNKPQCAFLFARNAAGSGAGEHHISSIRVDWDAKFTRAPFVNYGAEVITHEHCYFGNSEPGETFAYIQTGFNNLYPVQSVYTTMATGAQSNTVFSFYGCTAFHHGGTQGSLFLFDGVADWHWHDGIFINGNYQGGGFSYIKIDGRNAPSDMWSLTGVRGEPGQVTNPRYGVYYDGTAACQTWSIKGNRLQVTDATVFANNGYVWNLNYEDNGDTTGVGVKLKYLTYSNVDLRTAFFQPTAGGVVSYTSIKSIAANVSLTGMTQVGVMVTDVLTGAVNGVLPHAIGAWVLLTYLNSWAHSTGNPTLAYRLDPRTKQVYLRGAITGGTADQPAYNVPAGFRPPLNLAVLVSAVVSGVRTTATCTVASNGDVYVWGVGGAGCVVDFGSVSYFID